MSTGNARHHLLAIALLGALTAGSVVGFAGPAGAHSSLPTRPRLCVRVENQWSRLAAANDRTKAAFDKALALQNRLIHAGRVAVAHRLDARLAHLRAIHAALVARVDALATRVRGRCSDRAPTFTDF